MGIAKDHGELRTKSDLSRIDVCSYPVYQTQAKVNRGHLLLTVTHCIQDDSCSLRNATPLDEQLGDACRLNKYLLLCLCVWPSAPYRSTPYCRSPTRLKWSKVGATAVPLRTPGSFG